MDETNVNADVDHDARSVAKEHQVARPQVLTKNRNSTRRLWCGIPRYRDAENVEDRIGESRTVKTEA